ncbi:HET-domain-containing protein [Microthyrium microscopicum]|uniref:HET-domain-containing protein n=1 Tax=Microthyrium microscopicum TaxID=703497 RepID=A0A6A6UT61_9PEZI|nr:HET-domain-containing protein [Microthyrium microscopicum]
MRLLNKRTLELKEFIGKEIPEYAILSHTWGAEEVTFQDIFAIDHESEQFTSIKQKAGWKKIEFMQRVTATSYVEYFWIDTCAIDKSSSSELSEAINSMFRWYRNAEICYVYLSDILSSDGDITPSTNFVESRWFTRGWTLQELIAPARLDFYTSDEHHIGTKKSLRGQISRVTGIDESVLIGVTDLSELSIARRMSWAADRETTRIEDMAYCLIGIFAINIPLLYGEGARAFRRLQEEIMRETYDQSILAWEFDQPGPADLALFRLFSIYIPVDVFNMNPNAPAKPHANVNAGQIVVVKGSSHSILKPWVTLKFRTISY